MIKLILGSKSIGRKSALETAGYVFEIMAADIDEKAIRSDNFEELPVLIARAKAQKLLPLINEPAILITSDQVVVCNGELREKPESISQAREYLKSYAHFPAQTNTAVVVTNTITGEQAEGLDIARTYFKPMPPQVIENIIKSGKAMNTAGGFITEDELFKPYIDHIEGDKTGVIGLPLKLTEDLIKKVYNGSLK